MDEKFVCWIELLGATLESFFAAKKIIVGALLPFGSLQTEGWSAAFTNCKTAFTSFVRQIYNVENQFVVPRPQYFEISMDLTEGGFLHNGVHFGEEKLSGNLYDHIWTRLYSPLFDAGCCSG